MERLGVGQIGHKARIEDVTDGRVAAEVAVALGVGGVALVEELGTGMYPVLTATQGQAPVAECHLVLNVQAGLAGFLIIVIVGGGAVRSGDRQAIHRVVHVDVRRSAIDGQEVVVCTLVIQADQQCVVDGAGAEVTLEVVVDGDLADIFIHVRRATPGVALVVHDIAEIGVGRDVAVYRNRLEREL
ncbi:hypothetical protein D3C80_1298890 [compost metagenome]